MSDGVPVQRLLRERVAEEVRALLARKRMTGAELAAAIGKSPMYVSRRVRGEVAFDLDDMERLAQVFEVEVTSLMPRPAADTSNSRSAQVIRPVSPVAGYGPFGQKPGGSTRPGSPKRRPILIGPGRRAM